eukprot:6193532-Pleurochrysis_carterae.AAC.4
MACASPHRLDSGGCVCEALAYEAGTVWCAREAVRSCAAYAVAAAAPRSVAQRSRSEGTVGS